MVSDFLHYACISRGTSTVLAEFRSWDENHVENVALECLEKAPKFHTNFSHTIRNKMYSFLMDHPPHPPFVYFTILDEQFGTAKDGFHFLERVREAFLNMLTTKSIPDHHNLTHHCFHQEFSPVFPTLMPSYSSTTQLREAYEPPPPPPPASLIQDHHFDDSMTIVLPNENGGDNVVVLAAPPPPPYSIPKSSSRKVISVPLLGIHPGKKNKKKNDDSNLPAADTNVDYNFTQEVSSKTIQTKLELNHDDHDGVLVSSINNDNFSVSLPKNLPSSYIGGVVRRHSGCYQAQKVWRKHVCTVLLIDLLVCCVLFAIWLLICGGFQCLPSR